MRVFVSRRLPLPWLAGLDAVANLDLDIWRRSLPPPRGALLDRIQGVDGLLCLLSDRIDDQLLAQAGPNLRVVSQMAVGVDNIDLAACARRDVAVGHTPGVLVDATADLTMALLLNAARRIPEAQSYLRAGRWKAWTPTLLLGREMRGSVLGIVGLGAIGSAVAERARAFGMTVRYWSRTEHPERAAAVGAEYQRLPTLLSEADFVSVHLALTPETRHLIGAPALALMQSHAWLINTARGAIVDTEALIEALEDRVIAGAALDVFETEPIDETHPLLALPNIIAVPHIGSATEATRQRMAERAVENLVAGLHGDALPWPAS